MISNLYCSLHIHHGLHLQYQVVFFGIVCAYVIDLGGHIWNLKVMGKGVCFYFIKQIKQFRENNI